MLRTPHVFLVVAVFTDDNFVVFNPITAVNEVFCGAEPAIEIMFVLGLAQVFHKQPTQMYISFQT